MILTLKEARNWMARCAQTGFSIEANPSRDRKMAYVVTDAERPGWKAYGRTPRQAIQNAGMIISQ